MKKIYILFGLCLKILSAKAQESIFDVPESDIIPQKKILAQVQTEITKVNIGTQATINYGLGHNWEIGLNLLKLNI